VSKSRSFKSGGKEAIRPGAPPASVKDGIPPGEPSSTAPREASRAPAAAASPWTRFWFTPADPIGLHMLRVLAGILFLLYLLPFAGEVGPLFGLGGWFDRLAYAEAARLPEGTPNPIGWSLLYLCDSDTAVAVFYGLSLLILVLFTIGIWPRVTAVLTWLVVASFTANPAVANDADPLLLLLSFYLMIGYLLFGQHAGAPLSWWLVGPAWPLGDRAADAGRWRRESVAANAAVRFLQVHFAIVMVTSALHQLQFPDWWNGSALWYPLHPPLDMTAASLRELRLLAPLYLFVLSAAAYAGLAWHLALPAFAWRRGWLWRGVLLGGAVLGWMTTAWVYDLPLFGPALLICCLAYLTPREWQWLNALLHRSLSRLRRRPAAALPDLARRGAPASTLATPR
jgi:hypothetical protein